jgi:hypothetical protein
VLSRRLFGLSENSAGWHDSPSLVGMEALHS